MASGITTAIAEGLKILEKFIPLIAGLFQH